MLSDLPTTGRYSSGSLWGQPDSRVPTFMAGLLDFPHTARQAWEGQGRAGPGSQAGLRLPKLGPGETTRLPESASVSPFLLVSVLGFPVPSPLLLWSSWPWSLLAPALVPPPLAFCSSVNLGVLPSGLQGGCSAVAVATSLCFPHSPPLCLWQAVRTVHAWASGSDSRAQILSSLELSEPD